MFSPTVPGSVPPRSSGTFSVAHENSVALEHGVNVRAAATGASAVAMANEARGATSTSVKIRRDTRTDVIDTSLKVPESRPALQLKADRPSKLKADRPSKPKADRPSKRDSTANVEATCSSCWAPAFVRRTSWPASMPVSVPRASIVIVPCAAADPLIRSLATPAEILPDTLTPGT